MIDGAVNEKRFQLHLEDKVDSDGDFYPRVGYAHQCSAVSNTFGETHPNKVEGNATKAAMLPALRDPSAALTCYSSCC